MVALGLLLVAGAIAYGTHLIERELRRLADKLDRLDQTLKPMVRSLDHLDDTLSGDQRMSLLGKMAADNTPSPQPSPPTGKVIRSFPD